MTNLEKMREKLQDQINYHNVLYHQKNKPEISDAEYDELKKKLAEIEPEIYVVPKHEQILSTGLRSTPRSADKRRGCW